MPDGDTPPLAEPRENALTIRKIFENEKIVKKLQSSVPRHLNPERMLRTFSLAIQKTPKLAECDPLTLLGAMMVLASLGLEPNTPLGHAYLIPFEKRERRGREWVSAGTEVNVIIGYKGYIDLGRRSGSLVSLHADVVYGPSADKKLRGDDFSFEYGSAMHLRHVPIGDNEGRPPVWAYAHALLKDGQAFEVLPYERVQRIRNSAQGYQAALRAKNQYGDTSRAWTTAPWVAYEHEMAAKTMIRRLAKMLPLSIEFANAAALDAMSETGEVDLSAFADGVDMTTMDIGEARMLEHSQEEPLDTSVKQAPPLKQPVETQHQGSPAAEPGDQSQPSEQAGAAGAGTPAEAAGEAQAESAKAAIACAAPGGKCRYAGCEEAGHCLAGKAEAGTKSEPAPQGAKPAIADLYE